MVDPQSDPRQRSLLPADVPRSARAERRKSGLHLLRGADRRCLAGAHDVAKPRMSSACDMPKLPPEHHVFEVLGLRDEAPEPLSAE
jgi:hypothetical protein